MTIQCPKCRAENPESKQFCGDCGTRLGSSAGPQPRMTETVRTPVRELNRGRTFAGRYDIIEELGKGGMGKVYRVFDRKIEEEVALKLIRPEIAEDGEIIDRFRNELKVSRRISHRNVSRMFDIGEDEGTYFITMEYVSGEDLKSFIHRSKTLNVGTAAAIAEQVCEGLEEAHRLGIVHRDLKPGNIMIDKEGNARIMDFGIARSLAGKGITGAGVMIGTPEYMSPEQVEGKDVDPRSDIYSLGVILFEMTTGRVPFGGDTPFSVGVKHKVEKPVDPRSLNPQIPEELSRLILKCLEKSRDKRFQSAAELRAELGKIERDITTTERGIVGRRPITSRVFTVKFQLRKLLLPAAAILAVAAGALLLARLLPRRAAPPPASGKPTLAILYFENISGDKSLDAWRTGLTELLIAKLGQSRLLRVLDGNTIYGLMRRLNLDDARKYTQDDLLRIAHEAGATYTLSGSVLKAGPDIVMTFSLQKPHTREVISPIRVDCRGEGEIIGRIDEVADKVKSDLDLSMEQIAADPDKKAAAITTTSAEAFKCYSQGRKFHSLGDYQRCIEWMQKAVALDPSFAMAYRSLGSAYNNLGQRGEGIKFYQKALEFRDRVSDRERLSIEGDFYRQSEATLEKAVAAYHQLLDLYPDDLIGNTNLGVLYTDSGEYDKAIERFKYLVDAGLGDVNAVGNLAETYGVVGKYDEAIAVLKRYLSRVPDNAAIHGKLALAYLPKGQYDLALQEADRAESLNPADFTFSWTRAGILIIKDDLPEAEREARKLLQFTTPTARYAAWEALVRINGFQGRFRAARELAVQALATARQLGDSRAISSIMGSLATIDEFIYRNFDQALAEADEGLRLSVDLGDVTGQRSHLWRRGLLYLDKNMIPDAERVAAELTASYEKSLVKTPIGLALDLRARIDLAKHDSASALSHVRQMIALWPMPGASSLLADALDMAGDKKGAFAEYQKIATGARMRADDAAGYLRSFYRLGQLSEALGLRDKAVEYYGRLLEMWKNGDAGLPFVEDMRKRMTALRGT